MLVESVSAIIPTIGRPSSLAQLLSSLLAQTVRVDEAIVADASTDDQIAKVVGDGRWKSGGLTVRHIVVSRPNAVCQRDQAILSSSSSHHNS